MRQQDSNLVPQASLGIIPRSGSIKNDARALEGPVSPARPVPATRSAPVSTGHHVLQAAQLRFHCRYDAIISTAGVAGITGLIS